MPRQQNNQGLKAEGDQELQSDRGTAKATGAKRSYKAQPWEAKSLQVHIEATIVTLNITPHLPAQAKKRRTQLAANVDTERGKRKGEVCREGLPDCCDVVTF